MPWDAKKKVAKRIVDSGADYVLQLKANHPVVYDEVRTYVDDCVGGSFADFQGAFVETVDGDHGRVTTRRYWLNTDIAWFKDRHLWENLTGFAVVESESERHGNTSTHRRYYLTSLDNVDDVAKAIRSHWAIENSLHWVLDVAFDEDQNRSRKGNGAANFATIRQTALNLIKQETVEKVGVKTKRKMCGWDHDYLLTVLGLKPNEN